MGACSKRNCSAIVDTGTSLLAGPTDIVNAFIDKLNVSSDCSNFDSLPDIGFIIGGRTLTLTPEDYVDISGPHDCGLSLMSQDSPPPKSPQFILGDPFLRKYYTVFNRETSEIGFALATHPRGERPKHIVATVTSATSEQ